MKNAPAESGAPSTDNPEAVYYLSSPYTHPTALGMESRYFAAQSIAYWLMTTRGHTLIEPIGMSHAKAKAFSMPTTYDFWQRMNQNWIRKCDGVIVATMIGWHKSKGVTDEIAFATKLGIPVYYLDVHADPMRFTDTPKEKEEGDAE